LTLSNSDDSVNSTDSTEETITNIKIEEGKEIIRALSALKHDMGRNKALSYVPYIPSSSEYYHPQYLCSHYIVFPYFLHVVLVATSTTTAVLT
jgi:hypothetical protein